MNTYVHRGIPREKPLIQKMRLPPPHRGVVSSAFCHPRGLSLLGSVDGDCDAYFLLRLPRVYDTHLVLRLAPILRMCPVWESPSLGTCLVSVVLQLSALLQRLWEDVPTCLGLLEDDCLAGSVLVVTPPLAISSASWFTAHARSTTALIDILFKYPRLTGTSSSSTCGMLTHCHDWDGSMGPTILDPSPRSNVHGHTSLVVSWMYIRYPYDLHLPVHHPEALSSQPCISIARLRWIDSETCRERYERKYFT